jgi:HlyD family secretion protein
VRSALVLLALAAGGVWAARYLQGKEGQAWRQRAGALVAGEAPKPDFVPTTRVARGALEVSLTVVGALKAEQSVPVTAGTSGTIVAIVEEGSPVKKGQVLVELQNDQLKLQIDEKRVGLVNALSRREDTERDRTLEAENRKTELAKTLEEQAIMKRANKADLESAEAALELQRTELALRRAQLGRDMRLAEERLITNQELEDKRKQVEAKEFEVARAEAQLELKRGKLASDENQKQAEVNHARFAADLAQRRIADEVRNAQQNVETFQRQLTDLQEQLKKSTIIAPADGVALLEQRWDGGQRPLRAGDMVSPQRKVMELPDLSKMIVTCEVAEKDIGPVRRGQPCRITLDPYPGLVYHGVVKDVAAVAKPANIEGIGFMQSKNSFTTIIQVKETDAKRLRPGMNANVEILASTAKDTVYVPVDALFERREKPLVYRMRGAGFAATPVRLGPRNKDYAVVQNGVGPGDTIALVLPPEKMILR